jgi:hypothetical protein
VVADTDEVFDDAACALDFATEDFGFFVLSVFFAARAESSRDLGADFAALSPMAKGTAMANDETRKTLKSFSYQPLLYHIQGLGARAKQQKSPRSFFMLFLFIRPGSSGAKPERPGVPDVPAPII